MNKWGGWKDDATFLEKLFWTGISLSAGTGLASLIKLLFIN
tara:strand:- start:6 stop:128 length:123 start_codon:yes stop_codon:yes gene_type:complete